MTDIQVSVDPGEIQTVKADSRGRVNLGSEYGGEELTVAVLGRVDGGDGEEQAPGAVCPNDGVQLVARRFEEGGLVVECPECGYTAGSVTPPKATELDGEGDR